MQQRIGLASSPDCHHQGISDELRRHRCAHRPANDPAREQIDEGSHIEPAFCDAIRTISLPPACRAARNSRVEEDLVDQLFNSSEKRLARTLLLLANFGKEGRPEPIIAKVSQETLAEMIGTTRSRVSFFMNKFRKLGLIDYNGNIEIHSSLLNVVLRDQPHIRR